MTTPTGYPNFAAARERFQKLINGRTVITPDMTDAHEDYIADSIRRFDAETQEMKHVYAEAEAAVIDMPTAIDLEAEQQSIDTALSVAERLKSRYVSETNVIAALNEEQADDKPAEEDFADVWCWDDRFVQDHTDDGKFGSAEWFANIPEQPFGLPILERRREEILAAFREEPITKEQAGSLIEELAEIEASL